MTNSNYAVKEGAKPVFSGHETFPLRYGWLKKAFDMAVQAEKQKKPIKDIFNSDDSIATFGVGKNMVSAIRHWAQVCGVFDVDNERELKINNFARELLDDNGLDPWMENPATIWYFHWNLASNSTLITYDWFFNYWNGALFDRDSLSKSLIELAKEKNWTHASPLTVKRDVECFIRMYVPKVAKNGDFDEDSVESPLTELGLIAPIRRRDVFQPRRGWKSNLSIHTFVYGLLKFWEIYAPTSSTLSLEAVCYEPKSPGRIFFLDEDAVVGFAQKLASETNGLLEWSETAGLRQIVLNPTDKYSVHLDVKARKSFVKNYKG
jgi:hypothetical protein